MLKLFRLFVFTSAVLVASLNSRAQVAGAVTLQDPLKISFAQMEARIARVEAVYAPVFVALGLQLKFIKKWDSLQANASTERVLDTAQVYVLGGLARAPYMTEDHFTLILCHELGHHLAGRPHLKSGSESWWSSAEPQADYFAAKECMKRVLIPGQGEAAVPPVVRQSCHAVYATADERELCTRTALAGELFAKRDYRLNNFGEDPKVALSLTQPFGPRPDLRYDFTEYPSSQCRMDTFYQGSLCNKDKCDGAVGGRPHCWLYNVSDDSVNNRDHQ